MIMFKFVTIYRRVDDEMALENFFSGTQLPLSEQLPGLQKTELSRIDGKPGGNSRYYLMYELYFESYPQFALALSSPPGQQLMAALAPWAENKLITWFYATSYESSQVR